MTRDEIRRISTALYGNSDRLFAAAAIARLSGKPISAKAVAEESGLELNRAQEQVAHFRRAGLLLPDHDPERRRREHSRVELSYWDAADELLNELLVAEGLIVEVRER